MRFQGYQPTDRPGMVRTPPPQRSTRSRLTDDDLADIGARLRRCGLEEERRAELRERLLADQLDSTPADRRRWLVLGFGAGFAAATLAICTIAAVLG